MDGADWLRTQLASFRCGSCGRRYRSARIRFLAERDGLFFIDLGCNECGAEAVAIVTVDGEDVDLTDGPVLEVPDDGAPDGTSGPRRPRERGVTREFGRGRRRLREQPLERAEHASEPLTADDLLDMHEFLGAFDGDFRRLFAEAPPRDARAS